MLQDTIGMDVVYDELTRWSGDDWKDIIKQ